MFLSLFYLTGVAYFRALRYRLSRTYWRGIRGGSEDPGFRYGLSYIWKTLVGSLALAGMAAPARPKTTTRLFNLNFINSPVVKKRVKEDSFAEKIV